MGFQELMRTLFVDSFKFTPELPVAIPFTEENFCDKEDRVFMIVGKMISQVKLLSSKQALASFLCTAQLLYAIIACSNIRDWNAVFIIKTFLSNINSSYKRQHFCLLLRAGMLEKLLCCTLMKIPKKCQMLWYTKLPICMSDIYITLH